MSKSVNLKYLGLNIVLDFHRRVRVLILSEDEVASLVKLGLTTSQAKVYLTLVRTGLNSAHEISEKSNIARPEVYPILSTLQKMGLVEEELTFPNMFQATPLHEAITALIQLRKKDLKQLQIEMNTFMKKFEKSQESSNKEDEDYQIKLFPAHNAFVNRSKELARDSIKIIEIIMPIRRTLQAIPFYESTILNAKKRGVKARLITENVKNKALLMKIEKVYSETKFVPKGLIVGFTIYDRESTLIVYSPTSNFPESNGLWSNNPSIVKLAINYFDNIWNKF